ncbi:hypothetical protein EJB05_01830, partial [Eragrostis curvula]
MPSSSPAHWHPNPPSPSFASFSRKNTKPSRHGRLHLSSSSPPPQSLPKLGPNREKVRKESLYPTHNTNFKLPHPVERSAQDFNHGRRVTTADIDVKFSAHARRIFVFFLAAVRRSDPPLRRTPPSGLPPRAHVQR